MFVISANPSSFRALKEYKDFSGLLFQDIRCILRSIHSIGRNKKERFKQELNCVEKAQSVLKQVPFQKIRCFVSPELLGWYFRSLFFLERSWHRKLVDHIHQLPSLLFLPLLKFHNGGPDLPMSIPTDPWGKLQILYLPREISFNDSKPDRVVLSRGNGFLCFQKNKEKQTISLRRALSGLMRNSRKKLQWISSTGISYHQEGSQLDDWLRELEKDSLSLLGRQVKFKPISFERLSSDCKWMQKSMEKAICLIGSTWPELYQELKIVIQRISLIEGTHIIGASNIAYQGVIILNPKKHWSVQTFADHIIHEGSHNILSMVSELTPLLLNPSKSNIRSPIRKDLRPLYAVFHATFVLFRLVHFFEKLLKKDSSFDVYSRFHRHLDCFYKGMRTISSHARFSKKGKQLFEQMNRAYKKLTAHIPYPDTSVFVEDYQ